MKDIKPIMTVDRHGLGDVHPSEGCQIEKILLIWPQKGTSNCKITVEAFASVVIRTPVQVILVTRPVQIVTGNR